LRFTPIEKAPRGAPFLLTEILRSCYGCRDQRLRASGSRTSNTGAGACTRM
jgi:hypothetical protein